MSFLERKIVCTCKLPFQDMNVYKGFILEVSSHQQECDFVSDLSQGKLCGDCVVLRMFIVL